MNSTDAGKTSQADKPKISCRAQNDVNEPVRLLGAMPTLVVGMWLGAMPTPVVGMLRPRTASHGDASVAMAPALHVAAEHTGKMPVPPTV